MHINGDFLIEILMNNSLKISGDEEDNSKWNDFVDSIKSKLTVQQVIDGVRGGGNLTFDYLLLIVTAELVSFLLWHFNDFS